MSEIDWSKAPEGATHWDTGMNGRVAGWMKRDGETWYWWPAENAFSCPKKWHASLNQHMVKSEGFITRPTYWNAEGLPPVGVMCEYLTLDCGEYWCKASVSYVGTHWVVVGYDHPTQGISEAGVNHVLLNGNLSSRLRPLLTPEQIAARERKEIEEDIQRVCMTGENCGTPYYKALYDAGYRKFEIIDEPKS